MASTPLFHECINTRLNRVTRIVNEIYRKHLEGIGVSESQMSILLHLYDHNPLMQSELGKNLHLQRSTVTRNLERMVKGGYIAKKGTELRPEIHLTAKGKRLVKKIQPAWEAAMEEIGKLLASSGMTAVDILDKRVLPK